MFAVGCSVDVAPAICHLFDDDSAQVPDFAVEILDVSGDGDEFSIAVHVAN